MRLNKNYIQTFMFVLVYLFAIYFWSQPYHEREIPYGEFDAMSHFEVADYMAYTDKSMVDLPPYIDIRYGGDNKFKPHTLWYPPTFHTSLGVMEVIGGERMVPIYLLNTIMASFIIITVYFVMNSLFGFFPAILSSLLLIFSPRDFMPYLWGQWPERFAYAFIPIVLYCLYKYFISFSKEEKKPTYLYLTALFLGINLLVHPLVFFHTIAAIVVLYIFLAIKQKKIVFNWKHVSISAIIFLVLFMLFPYQTFNIFPSLGMGIGSGAEGTRTPMDFSRLFQWSLDPEDYSGSVPSSYFSFKEMHGLWTLPFLIIGILFLAFRREEKDLFLMAWLVSLYLVMHRDLIGIQTFLHRSLSATAHIFVPLTALGTVYLGSFIKLPSNYNKYLKYALVALFIYFTFSVNMASASKSLNKDTYNNFFTTLNPYQYDLGVWILENVPPSYNVSVLGLPYIPQLLDADARKVKWLAAVSHHVTRFYPLDDEDMARHHLENFYIVVDYTMLIPLKDREPFNSILTETQLMEKTILINHTLLYNKDNIKVYKLEPEKQ
jgi:hypothetical protein